MILRVFEGKLMFLTLFVQLSVCHSTSCVGSLHHIASKHVLILIHIVWHLDMERSGTKVVGQGRGGLMIVHWSERCLGFTCFLFCFLVLFPCFGMD